MLRFLTAGESHGEALVGILEGMPAGVKIDTACIDEELRRRQKGYGRGARMQIEQDRVHVLSGLIRGLSIGSPIALMIANKDASIDKLQPIKNPRPGHADMAGILKYGFKDARCVLERSSARETAMRVAIGALCKILLNEFDIQIISHVLMIGGIEAHAKGLAFEEIAKAIKGSKLNCADKASEKIMMERIDSAKAKKDTLGGVFEVIVRGAPAGLGTCMHCDRRLDAMLAQAVMSIPSVKAVEIGNAIESAGRFGSGVHDEIFYSAKKGVYRKTNNAGGIEGGMSNGENIIVRGYMKPISTLMQGLHSINIDTKKSQKASTERSDVCAVPSGGVIAEAMAGFVIAGAFLEKFGSDNLAEIKRNYTSYIDNLAL